MEITEAEAQLYDRQIRLWGLDAQKRLRNARVLVIGMSGLGTEVSKNIVLAGVKSLIMIDPENVCAKDAASQFLAPRDKMGFNRAEASRERLQQLNSMVEVRAESGKVEDKSDDYFRDFDIVCATGLVLSEYMRINEACRARNVKFFCGDVTGFFGYCFADLMKHEFVVETPAKNVECVDLNELEFVTLRSAMKTNFKAPGIKLKRMDPGFFILRVVQDFYTNHGSLPLPEKKSEHIPLLHKIRDKITRDYDLPEGKIPETIIPMLFGELAPVFCNSWRCSCSRNDKSDFK
ncbi:UBLE1A [Lepeophtheirus salmonis]|uniref:SUMO-activating enzyme subunit 1 n=1 Tax=Lepeophtheirus salmonis TaxID=72036 RepID=A0A7R8HC57_LEPSM|nr:UBLE1A [Lepeophtheirus salmonis]CAF2983788.1 UBLE1A [Lepeophtheirus salmonis]